MRLQTPRSRELFFSGLFHGFVACTQKLSGGIKDQHYHIANSAPRTRPNTLVDVWGILKPGTAAPVKVAGATTAGELGGGVVAGAGGTLGVLAGGAAGGAPPPKVKLGDSAGGAAGGGGGGDAGDAGGGVSARGSMAALAMYASMVLGDVSFWLITMAMPF